MAADKDRYLWHLTLDTGHGRRSYRSEVDDAIVSLIGQMIAEALSGLDPEIVPGIRLKTTAVSAALLATAIVVDGPLATFAIAGKSKVSGRLWQEVRKIAPHDARAEPLSAPWCAVKLHPALEDHLDKAGMLGDFGRCLAWAWIEGAGRAA